MDISTCTFVVLLAINGKLVIIFNHKMVFLRFNVFKYLLFTLILLQHCFNYWYTFFIQFAIYILVGVTMAEDVPEDTSDNVSRYKRGFNAERS